MEKKKLKEKLLANAGIAEPSARSKQLSIKKQAQLAEQLVHNNKGVREAALRRLKELL